MNRRLTMKKLLEKIIVGAGMAFCLTVFLLLPAATRAVVTFDRTNNYGLNGEFQKNIGLGQADIQGSVASIINIVLGILGIVAVVIIVAGGFTWMTAAGNEDKVGTAKKMITQGVIGLLIIFAAWGIAAFVINQLSKAANVA